MRYDIYSGVKRAKTKMQKIALVFMALALPVALALSTGGANAITGTYTLFGDAQLISPGFSLPNAIELHSTCPGGYPGCISGGTYTYGGVSYLLPSGTTFANLTSLSTQFKPASGDACVGGGPRFSIGIDYSGDGVRDGSIWAYFGSDSGAPACVAGIWQNTTDLLDPGRTLDTTQLTGGAYGDSYASALTKYGSKVVTSLSIVTDSGWAHGDGDQIIDIDNTDIAGMLYTYDQPSNKNQCKNGGWQNLLDDQGGSFNNQGDCVSYVATGGRNPASGN